jgi:hypothetical protein
LRFSSAAMARTVVNPSARSCCTVRGAKNGHCDEPRQWPSEPDGQEAAALAARSVLWPTNGRVAQTSAVSLDAPAVTRAAVDLFVWSKVPSLQPDDVGEAMRASLERLDLPGAVARAIGHSFVLESRLTLQRQWVLPCPAPEQSRPEQAERSARARDRHCRELNCDNGRL